MKNLGVSILVSAALFISALILTLDANAETTGNQLDPNHEDGFLGGEYNYPDIHMHTQIGLPNDPYIYSGNYNTQQTATQIIDVSIPDGHELDAINWSVDVSNGAYVYNDNGQMLTGMSNGADIITINLVFIDINGSTLATAGPGRFTTTYTDGGWHTYSGTYDNSEFLDDITSLWFTIGGQDYQGHGDGVRFSGMEVTYDYSETVIIQIEEEIIEEIIESMLDQGVPESVIEEMFIEPEIEDSPLPTTPTETEDDEMEEEVEETETETETEIETETEESSEEVEEEVTEEAEVSDEKESSDDKKESSDDKKESSDNSTTEEKSNDQSNTGSNGTTNQTPTSVLDTLSSGEDVLSLLDMVQTANAGINNNVVLGDIIDFRSYTTLSLQDVIELEENGDWYEEQEFYKNSILPDSGILESYKYNNIEEIEFYD